jgi:hypothetical protein
MRSQRLALVFALLISLEGCGGEPEADRFTLGDKVIAFEHKTGNGDSNFKLVIVSGTGESLSPMVPFGTHLTIVKDEEGIAEGRTWSSREVLIHIEEGPHKGKTGTVTRWSLRKSP